LLRQRQMLREYFSAEPQTSWAGRPKESFRVHVAFQQINVIEWVQLEWIRCQRRLKIDHLAPVEI
jgi:hypothetical protein